MFISMTTVADVSEFAGSFVEWLKQVQAGNEVLLTQGNKPVAKLVPASEPKIESGTPLRIRSLKGHRVLTPVLSQEELAEELFAPR